MPTAVITGCSTGFGRVTAFYLAERGWRVLATVRQAAQQTAMLAEAAERGLAGQLVPVLCDITQPQAVAALAQQAVDDGAGLNALVNNAGTAFPGPLERLPLADVRAQLEVNLIGQLALIQALLPALKAARGTIINVSSVGGRVTFPMHGAYSMSKFALEAMSEALRLELAHFGVRVVVAAPGSSPTPIWETGRQRARRSPMGANLGEYAPLAAAVERMGLRSAASGFPPELFARAIWGILNNPHPAAHYYVPRSAGLIVATRRLLPDWLWDLVARRVLRW